MQTRNKSPKVSQEVEKRIIDLFKKGLGAGRIALLLKITTGSIGLVLKRHGLKRTPEQARNIMQANNLYHDGKPSKCDTY